jgi:hypothetical protein
MVLPDFILQEGCLIEPVLHCQREVLGTDQYEDSLSPSLVSLPALLPFLLYILCMRHRHDVSYLIGKHLR